MPKLNDIPAPTKLSSDAILKIYGKYVFCAILIISGFVLANSALEYVGIILGLTLAFVDTYPSKR